MISLQIDSFSSFDAWTKGINGINCLISASFRFQPIYFLSLQANVFLNSSSTQKGIILIVDMASVYLSNDTRHKAVLAGNAARPRHGKA